MGSRIRYYSSSADRGDTDMGPQSKWRVLVADDDEHICNLLSAAFERIGIECETANDGVKAQNMIRARRYDAFVSDLAMPRLNGHRLFVELTEKSHPAMLFTITGVAEPKLVRDLIVRGVRQIFHKPVDVDIVAATVAACLERREHTK